MVMISVGILRTKMRKMTTPIRKSQRPSVLQFCGHFPSVAVLLARISNSDTEFILARLSATHVHSESTTSYT